MPVPPTEQDRQDREMQSILRTQQSRRGVRLNSRVPVLLEWADGRGGEYQEKAYTRVVNCYGCLLVSPKEVGLEQRLHITNLATRQPIDAVVVWKGKQRVEGWEVGVELVSPRMDYWGLDL